MSKSYWRMRIKIYQNEVKQDKERLKLNEDLFSYYRDVVYPTLMDMKTDDQQIKMIVISQNTILMNEVSETINKIKTLIGGKVEWIERMTKLENL